MKLSFRSAVALVLPLLAAVALSLPALLAIAPTVALAEALPTVGSGSAATLKASPAGKALCPFVVRNSVGTAQATVDCSGNATATGYVSAASVSTGALTTTQISNPSDGVPLIIYGDSQAGGYSGVDVVASGNNTYPFRVRDGSYSDLFLVSNGGVGQFPGGLAVNSQKVTSLANGTAAADAAAWGQVYETIGGSVGQTSSPQVGAEFTAPTGTSKVKLFTFSQNATAAGATCSLTFGLFDVTAAAYVAGCSSTSALCTGPGSGTIGGCTGAALVAGHIYQVGSSTSGFTTRPGYYLGVQLTH